VATQQLELFDLDDIAAEPMAILIRRLVNNIWREISKLPRRQQTRILQKLQLVLDNFVD
jgi:hypothetical protein